MYQRTKIFYYQLLSFSIFFSRSLKLFKNILYLLILQIRDSAYFSTFNIFNFICIYRYRYRLFVKLTLNFNADFVKQKPSAVLPELNSRIDFATDELDPKVTNSAQNIYLPIFGKEHSTKTLKQANDRRKFLLLLFIFKTLYFIY